MKNLAEMKDLEEIIDQKMGEIRTESLDLSFGEIVSLYEEKELIIQPEYQRLFRWSDEQKSRLIESILLKLPIPQIFVIENSEGVLELIDGLQRVSSVIQFINPSVLNLEPLKLQGCNLVSELNGKTFNDLFLTLKLRIKRSSVRTIFIKKQRRKEDLKYYIFQRLNAGIENISPQEIRNCSARMVGEDGVKFYEFLINKANYKDFKKCIETLSDYEKNRKGDEELVLRFFAAKNALDLFKGSVTSWLDLYMKEILVKEENKEKRTFDYDKEETNFNNVFEFLAEILGNEAFVMYKNNQPKGGLKPAYYEAISVGTSRVYREIINLSSERIKQKIIETVQSDEFKENTGSLSNRKNKLKGRIETIEKALLGLVNE